jgi:UPF0755 protein
MRTIIVLFIVVVVAGLAAFWWEDNNFSAPGPATAATTVIVEPGSGLSQIAGELEKAGVVEDAFLFRAGVMRRGQTASLKAGEYAFPPQVSMARVMEMLVEHEAIEHKITVAEGLTSDMATALVNADTVLVGPPATAPEEGAILPETYLFERGTTRAQLMARMVKSRTDALTQLWAKRQAGLPFKTPQEALIMASIVEKETGVPQERGRVARVLINRLQRGIKLEADPTIIYGLTKGVPLGHPLRVSELNKPNPYSTYQIVGLPPGPICNPGRDAIAATLNPPPSNELFFVADGSGGHAFAVTLAEHEKNVAHWRRLQNTRAQAQSPQPVTPR